MSEGPKKHKYDEHFKEFDKKAGRVHNVTKPVGRPRQNVNKVPFEEWDWEKEDKEFYDSFMRIRDAKNPDAVKQVKWNRYYQSLPAGDAHMRDFSMRTFARRMKFEIFLFTSGVICAFFCKRDSLLTFSHPLVLQC
jgi:hypothetical protein